MKFSEITHKNYLFVVLADPDKALKIVEKHPDWAVEICKTLYKVSSKTNIIEIVESLIEIDIKIIVEIIKAIKKDIYLIAGIMKKLPIYLIVIIMKEFSEEEILDIIGTLFSSDQDLAIKIIEEIPCDPHKIYQKNLLMMREHYKIEK